MDKETQLNELKKMCQECGVENCTIKPLHKEEIKHEIEKEDK